MTLSSSNQLPLILAGPIIRDTSPHQLTFWLVTSRTCAMQLQVHKGDTTKLLLDTELSTKQLKRAQVGKQAFVTLISIQTDHPLPLDIRLYYDILLQIDDDVQRLSELLPDLLYPGQNQPSFIIRQQITNLLHGSCRKPHHPSGDSLLRVDDLLAQGFKQPDKQPDMLIMSGDQVYTDDVAGPMLMAIHQTIERLGLFHEPLQGALVGDSQSLVKHSFSYYQRAQLLPANEATETLFERFFSAKKKPVFTSVNANNHLMSLAEVIAMYLLVWSPSLWDSVEISDANIDPVYKAIFNAEQPLIEAFCQGLSQVRRAFAHLPVYMIFDDHDVTDDWNLTPGWELSVYSHPFAKRIVGNALIGYWLCQGWGNKPQRFDELEQDIDRYFCAEGLRKQEELVDRLLDWDQWHYHLDTQPKIVVLDTRTQRWRSESSLRKPSGLMDWEALSELQQELIDQPAVIMISAAPVFGVKLIEIVQRIFTFFGHALTVDAENWMAHRGTANVMLNIFRHYKTPPHFVILSGDVHYSFVYDIRLRFRRNSPKITQFTCSGIKNQFPERLLKGFDTLNRILYGHRSLLNLFTQRRNMQIRHRHPGDHKLKTLLNCAGIGQLKTDHACKKVEANVLCHDGKTVGFRQVKEDH